MKDTSAQRVDGVRALARLVQEVQAVGARHAEHVVLAARQVAQRHREGAGDDGHAQVLLMRGRHPRVAERPRVVGGKGHGESLFPQLVQCKRKRFSNLYMLPFEVPILYFSA